MQSDGNIRQRRCLGCGRHAAKEDLLRLVRINAEQFAYDATGKAPGRGAYVCDSECFTRACKHAAVARSLRVHANDEGYESVARQLKGAGGLPAGRR